MKFDESDIIDYAIQTTIVKAGGFYDALDLAAQRNINYDDILSIEKVGAMK
jgi:hypothetical protein